jgi:hypothetical protein
VQVPTAARHVRGVSQESAGSEGFDYSFGALPPSPELFRERGELLLKNVAGTVHSVVIALCSHALRSAAEAVRDATLSVGGVHQCQVDLACLKRALDLPVLHALFQDVRASCECRILSASLHLLESERVQELVNGADM